MIQISWFSCRVFYLNPVCTRSLWLVTGQILVEEKVRQLQSENVRLQTALEQEQQQNVASKQHTQDLQLVSHASLITTRCFIKGPLFVFFHNSLKWWSIYTNFVPVVAEEITDSTNWDYPVCTRDSLRRQHYVRTSKEYLIRCHILLQYFELVFLQFKILQQNMAPD